MSSGSGPATAYHLHDPRTLGEIKVDAFEQDVVINDRSQAFSAELLRLALLGVGGVGYIASRTLTYGSPAEAIQMNLAAKWLVLIAAVSFGICAASALCLRYLASDLIAFQLRIARLRIRGTADDRREADGEETLRNHRLKLMRPMLLVSSGALAFGAGMFIAFLLVVLRLQPLTSALLFGLV